MAFQVQSLLLTSRTMRKGNMVVSDVIEEVDLLLLQR